MKITHAVVLLVVGSIVVLFANAFISSHAQAQTKPLPAVLSKTICPEYSRAAIVNLPPGQKFVSIMPKEQASEMKLSFANIYITRERENNEPARCITFNKPGSMPHSWEPALFIQEN